jgi:hypothetical protein
MRKELFGVVGHLPVGPRDQGESAMEVAGPVRGEELRDRPGRGRLRLPRRPGRTERRRQLVVSHLAVNGDPVPVDGELEPGVPLHAAAPAAVGIDGDA